MIGMPILHTKVIRTRDFGKGYGEDFIKDFFICPVWEEGIVSALKKAGMMDEVFAIGLSIYTRKDAEEDDDFKDLIEEASCPEVEESGAGTTEKGEF